MLIYLLFSGDFKCLHLHKHDPKDTKLNFFFLGIKLRQSTRLKNSERKQCQSQGFPFSGRLLLENTYISELSVNIQSLQSALHECEVDKLGLI